MTRPLTQTLPISCLSRMKDESSSSDEDHGSFHPLVTSSSFCFKKTLRLTSEQLVQYFASLSFLYNKASNTLVCVVSV